MREQMLVSDINMESIKKAKEQVVWRFANDILYKMCEEYPKHTVKSEIIGKIWLIGRTYAAAVERSRKKITYHEHVGPKIKEIGDQLDKSLACIKKHPRINQACLVDMLKVHNFLTKQLHNITGLNNRSLASKYLHFHAPNYFYIYDSQAVKGISAYHLPCDELKKDLLKELDGADFDGPYFDYVVKAYTLNEQLSHLPDVTWLTPRELDALLLGY